MSVYSEWKRYELVGPSRQQAVELLEQDIVFADLTARKTITLPVFAAKVILDCAKDGRNRGQGRQRPSDSTTVRIRKKSVADWTRGRATELIEAGMKRSHAKIKAAEEAQARFGTGRSAGYIRRDAYSKF